MQAPSSLIIGKQYVYIFNQRRDVVMRAYEVARVTLSSLKRLALLTFCPEATTHLHVEDGINSRWTYTDWKRS